jgi:hypothetical protein
MLVNSRFVGSPRLYPGSSDLTCLVSCEVMLSVIIQGHTRSDSWVTVLRNVQIGEK